MTPPDRLREALEEYGQHKIGCGVWQTWAVTDGATDVRCTCGLAAAALRLATPQAADPAETCRRGSNPEQGIDGHWRETHDAEWLLSQPTCSSAEPPQERPTGADLAAMPEPEFAAFVQRSGIKTVTTDASSPETGAASVDAAWRERVEAVLRERLERLTNDEGEPLRVALIATDGGVYHGQEAGIAALLAESVLRAAIRAEAVAPPVAPDAHLDVESYHRKGERLADSLDIAGLTDYADELRRIWRESWVEGEAVAPVGLPLDVTALAGALYETDPPESWMRTGTDEYRKRAAAMLAIIARDGAALAAIEDPDHASE